MKKLALVLLLILPGCVVRPRIDNRGDHWDIRGCLSVEECDRASLIACPHGYSKLMTIWSECVDDCKNSPMRWKVSCL